MGDIARSAAETLLLAGKSVLLAGAPGTGKTRLGVVLSKRFTGLEPIIVVGRGDMTSQDLVYSYQPSGGGVKLVLGELAVSVIASWARLVEGLTPRWVLFDELNRMNAETVLGKLFTALDLSYREEVEIVPLNVVNEVVGSKELLETVSSYADLEPGRLKENLANIVARLRGLGLAGLPLPYSWRSVATVNMIDRAHLFRLGFALMRRYPVVIVPGVGTSVAPSSIDTGLLQKITNNNKIYSSIINIIRDKACDVALRELALRSRLTSYDMPLFLANVDTLKEALTRYKNAIDTAAAIASIMSRLGVEIGYAMLVDTCRVAAAAMLRDLPETTVADIVVASILLPQLGSLAPMLKIELMLQGNSRRAIKVASLLSSIPKLLGENSLSAIYAEALSLELPYTGVWMQGSSQGGY